MTVAQPVPNPDSKSKVVIGGDGGGDGDVDASHGPALPTRLAGDPLSH